MNLLCFFTCLCFFSGDGTEILNENVNDVGSLVLKELADMRQEFNKETENLRAELRTITERFRKTETKLEDSNELIKDTKEALDRVKEELKETLTELNNVKQEIVVAKSEIHSLKERFGHEKKDKTQKYTAQTTNSEADLENIEPEKKDWIKKHGAIKRQVSGSVAFSATSKPVTLNLGAYHTIIFDLVLSNYGNGYNNNTGIFTAPHSGIYVFYFAGMAKPGHSMEFQLTKDGSVRVKSFSDGRMSSSSIEGYDMSGNLGIMYLSQGSEVWVRSASTGEIFGGGSTTFSGFLLYEG